MKTIPTKPPNHRRNWHCSLVEMLCARNRILAVMCRGGGRDAGLFLWAFEKLQRPPNDRGGGNTRKEPRRDTSSSLLGLVRRSLWEGTRASWQRDIGVEQVVSFSLCALQDERLRRRQCLLSRGGSVEHPYVRSMAWRWCIVFVLGDDMLCAYAAGSRFHWSVKLQITQLSHLVLLLKHAHLVFVKILRRGR
jgi:hypothetical protein